MNGLTGLIVPPCLPASWLAVFLTGRAISNLRRARRVPAVSAGIRARGATRGTARERAWHKSVAQRGGLAKVTNVHLADVIPIIPPHGPRSDSLFPWLHLIRNQVVKLRNP